MQPTPEGVAMLQGKEPLSLTPALGSHEAVSRFAATCGRHVKDAQAYRPTFRALGFQHVLQGTSIFENLEVWSQPGGHPMLELDTADGTTLCRMSFQSKSSEDYTAALDRYISDQYGPNRLARETTSTGTNWAGQSDGFIMYETESVDSPTHGKIRTVLVYFE